MVKRATNHELCGSKKEKIGCVYKFKILRAEKYREKNKDKIHEQYLKHKPFRKKVSPDVHRNISYKRNFGITLNDYNIILKNQKGKCAICKQKESNGKNLSVDHDHKTGKVRGLLCNNCNRSLGLLKDDISVLKNCIKYLKKNEQSKK